MYEYIYEYMNTNGGISTPRNVFSCQKNKNSFFINFNVSWRKNVPWQLVIFKMLKCLGYLVFFFSLCFMRNFGMILVVQRKNK